MSVASCQHGASAGGGAPERARDAALGALDDRLAMDVLRSIRVQDVKPTRMAAAQEAAKTILREVPAHIDVGLVTFAGTAQVAQQATLDRLAPVSAIDGIQMQYGTAIGSAIVLCLAELFPDLDLRSVYQQLGSRLQMRTRDLELTAPLALLAAGPMVTGAGLSLRWFGRVA